MKKRHSGFTVIFIALIGCLASSASNAIASDCQTLRFEFKGRNNNRLYDAQGRDRERVVEYNLYVTHDPEDESFIPQSRDLFATAKVIKTFNDSVENRFIVEEFSIDNSSEITGEKLTRVWRGCQRWLGKKANYPPIVLPRDEELEGNYSGSGNKKYSNGTTDSLQFWFQIDENQNEEINSCDMKLNLEYTVQTVNEDSKTEEDRFISSIFTFELFPQNIEVLPKCVKDIREEFKGKTKW